MKVSDKFFQPPFLVFSLSTISITPQFGTSVDTVLEIHFPILELNTCIFATLPILRNVKLMPSLLFNDRFYFSFKLANKDFMCLVSGGGINS